ncbi:MAG TPA: hypothetical protein VJR24_16540 [Gemmatimonadaceae bacterium]|nr:hypothetical protein [Gemmatimonadaceae bacterium]
MSERDMIECPCRKLGSMPRTWTEVVERFDAGARLRPRLEQLATNGSTWMSVYRCRACGAAWASERPLGELQGGGPELFYRIDAADPVSWLDAARPLADVLRRMAEDRRFFEILGPDVGPERCREPGCLRLRINPGLYCRCHHFEMVMRRPCPFWDGDPAA